MRISLIISILIHLVIFLLIQKYESNLMSSEVHVLYRARLIGDEQLKKEYLKERKAKSIKDETVFSPDMGEITISLNTKDEKFRDYAKIIKKAIEKNWNYPHFAKEKGMEGKCVLFFSLNREGSLLGINIKKSTGYDVLDYEAKRSVEVSSPFPPFPGQMMFTKLNIIAEFNYVIKK